jgi:membrane protein
MNATARELAQETFRSYSRHGGRMLAAAVAFSSLLSVAPVLVIALHVAGLATGEERARAAVTHDLATWIGDEGAATLSLLIDHTRASDASGWASLTSLLVLMYASTRLFSQLKRALNHMWDVQARSGEGLEGKAWKQLRKRAVAFVMVLFVGIVIIGVVVLKTLLASATHALGGAEARAAWQCGEALVSLGATALLFAMVFKVMPDARIAWRDAWLGALATAALFSIGAALIGIYLGHKELAANAMYGPAASIVMLLLWVHYSAQVFFLGAALTGELARRSGRAIEPDEYGLRVRTDEVARVPG